MDSIKKSKIIAGENVVIENLKRKGLLPDDNRGSQQSLLFFNLFRQVREEIADENGYYLEDAIRKTFDRWSDENSKRIAELEEGIEKAMSIRIQPYGSGDYEILKELIKKPKQPEDSNKTQDKQ